MSGSTIGGIVGGTIGFFVGSPQLGWMIGSAIGGYLDPDQIEGPRLKDAQVQTSQEGVPRPIVYGTAQVAGNLIQRGPLVERRKKERAGKGGPEQITYHYYMTYAIRVCEGPIAGIRRIWRDDKLVYSLREGDFIDADSAGFASKLTIYLGNETQLPDPSLEALPAANGGGAGNVPSYRGSAYVVFENDDLTERRGTVPQYRFEVVSAGTAEAGWSGVEWIATDAEGTLQKSLGGTDWTSLPAYSTTATGDSLLYGGGSLVASDEITTHYSVDGGETWSASSFDGGGGGQYDGFHGNYVGGRFWVVPVDGDGGTNNRQGWSTTGASFTFTGLEVSGQQVTINGTEAFLVLGLNAGSCYVSTDRFATATLTSLFGASDYTQVVGTNGSRVMVVSRFGNSRYSDDGNTWSTSVAIGGVGNPHNCAGEGATWAVVGSSGITYSTNGGDTWSIATLPYSFVGADIKYARGLWVACGKNTTDSLPAILTSTDAITWTDRPNNFASTKAVASIVAMECGGISAPDSPGYYVTTDGEICGGSAGSISADTITVGQIVEDLCERVGIPAAKLDRTELTDVVAGFVVARQMPASEAIRSLQRGYRFDMPEWDKKLRGIKRGGAIKDTITDDDLVGDEEETRAQALEYPRKFNLIVSDPEANYEAVTITSARSPGWVASDNQTTVELPIIFSSANEREQVCDILHKVAWTEMAGRLKIELPEEWTWLTPSDCFNFNDKRWRTEKVEVLDGSMKVDAVRDRASAYTSNASGVTRNPTGPVSSIRGPTILQALNLPRLSTANDKPGMYVAATGLLPAWDGCTLTMSTDGGLTFRSVLQMISRATMGELTEGIGASGEPITVKVYDNRELDTITTAQMDDQQNGFAITTSGVSEVGQFQTATEVVDWQLTDVLRGQLNTDAEPHNGGDAFLLLDDAVYFLPLDSSLIGREIIFRAVTNGTAPENNASITATFDPLFTGPEVLEFLLTEANARLLAEDGSYLLEE